MQQDRRLSQGQTSNLDTPERVFTMINANIGQEQLSYAELVQLVTPHNGIPGSMRVSNSFSPLSGTELDDVQGGKPPEGRKKQINL